ncbi:nectin-4 isoform X3 [Haemorhous mexicanus]|uniref:nectin-4 isoform X3 n=1 Tax=Haemorhous mexicanus TaxID=30427 RepID=UPI0028BF2308|nr:nectin-4 isoform X3 [Haemorhous mexicanus]
MSRRLWLHGGACTHTHVSLRCHRQVSQVPPRCHRCPHVPAGGRPRGGACTHTQVSHTGVTHRCPRCHTQVSQVSQTGVPGAPQVSQVSPCPRRRRPRGGAAQRDGGAGAGRGAAVPLPGAGAGAGGAGDVAEARPGRGARRGGRAEPAARRARAGALRGPRAAPRPRRPGRRRHRPAQRRAGRRGRLRVSPDHLPHGQLRGAPDAQGAGATAAHPEPGPAAGGGPGPDAGGLVHGRGQPGALGALGDRGARHQRHAALGPRALRLRHQRVLPGARAQHERQEPHLRGGTPRPAPREEDHAPAQRRLPVGRVGAGPHGRVAGGDGGGGADLPGGWQPPPDLQLDTGGRATARGCQGQGGHAAVPAAAGRGRRRRLRVPSVQPRGRQGGPGQRQHPGTRHRGHRAPRGPGVRLGGRGRGHRRRPALRPRHRRGGHDPVPQTQDPAHLREVRGGADADPGEFHPEAPLQPQQRPPGTAGGDAAAADGESPGQPARGQPERGQPAWHQHLLRHERGARGPQLLHALHGAGDRDADRRPRRLRCPRGATAAGARREGAQGGGGGGGRRGGPHQGGHDALRAGERDAAGQAQLQRHLHQRPRPPGVSRAPGGHLGTPGDSQGTASPPRTRPALSPPLWSPGVTSLLVWGQDGLWSLVSPPCWCGAGDKDSAPGLCHLPAGVGSRWTLVPKCHLPAGVGLGTRTVPQDWLRSPGVTSLLVWGQAKTLVPKCHLPAGTWSWGHHRAPGHSSVPKCHLAAGTGLGTPPSSRTSPVPKCHLPAITGLGTSPRTSSCPQVSPPCWRGVKDGLWSPNATSLLSQPWGHHQAPDKLLSPRATQPGAGDTRGDTRDPQDSPNSPGPSGAGAPVSPQTPPGWVALGTAVSPPPGWVALGTAVSPPLGCGGTGDSRVPSPGLWWHWGQPCPPKPPGLWWHWGQPCPLPWAVVTLGTAVSPPPRAGWHWGQPCPLPWAVVALGTAVSPPPRAGGGAVQPCIDPVNKGPAGLGPSVTPWGHWGHGGDTKTRG